MTEVLRMSASEPVRASLPLRALRRLADSRELMLLALIVILIVGMTVLYPNNFPTRYNISAVLLNAAQNGILVAGMILLMIAGSFDLSIGSTLALAGVWAGVTVGWWHWPAPLGFLAAIGIGALAVIVNGAIVKRLGINALIATLATMTVYRGLTYLTAGTGVTPSATTSRSMVRLCSSACSRCSGRWWPWSRSAAGRSRARVSSASITLSAATPARPSFPAFASSG
jgi:ribose transport system permease protein